MIKQPLSKLLKNLLIWLFLLSLCFFAVNGSFSRMKTGDKYTTAGLTFR